jgi:hypothetical protein
MTRDALVHLIQRALRPEAAVEPRLPSRYEGRPGEPETEPDGVVTEAPARGAEPSDVAASPDRRTDPGRSGLGERDPVELTEGRRASPPDVPDHPARPPADGRAAAVTAEPRPPGREQGDVQGPVGHRVSPGLGPRLAHDETPPSAQPSARPVSKPSAPPVTPATSERTTEALTQAPGLVPAPEAPAAYPPAPDAEPVVHITIGRIEVRATLPADTPTPAEPPRERRVMSLEEYLDRRGQGTAP